MKAKKPANNKPPSKLFAILPFLSLVVAIGSVSYQYVRRTRLTAEVTAADREYTAYYKRYKELKQALALKKGAPASAQNDKPVTQDGHADPDGGND